MLNQEGTVKKTEQMMKENDWTSYFRLGVSLLCRVHSFPLYDWMSSSIVVVDEAYQLATPRTAYGYWIKILQPATSTGWKRWLETHYCCCCTTASCLDLYILSRVSSTQEILLLFKSENEDVQCGADEAGTWAALIPQILWKWSEGKQQPLGNDF